MSDVRPAPVRWALVGYGSGGRIFHAPLLAAEPAIELVAVVTRDADRRAAVRRDLPGAVCVASVGDLPAFGVRAVTISTPPATHLPLALDALGLGMHAVVDKPFAPTEAEAEYLAAAAEAAGLLAIPYHNRRWDGDFLTLAALVGSDRLGTVLRFESRIERSRPVRRGWPSDVSAGGGVLLDLGPHLVDQAIRLAGPAWSVRADVRTVRDGATADDTVILDLFHVDGAHSTLTASLAAPAAGPRFLLQGSLAGVRIDGFDGQEAQLKAGATPLTRGDRWGVDADRSARIGDAVGGRSDVRLERGRWDAFYRAAAAAITAGGPAPVAATDAVTVARILDAARQSARTGRTVPIGSPAPSG